MHGVEFALLSIVNDSHIETAQRFGNSHIAMKSRNLLALKFLPFNEGVTEVPLHFCPLLGSSILNAVRSVNHATFYYSMRQIDGNSNDIDGNGTMKEKSKA